jgi:calcineurin-like phosphoesterase
MGYFLENDITCMFGTHTHVQTADEEIINGRMAYITDVGMTGPKNSVIGLKKETALVRFSTGAYAKYECSNNEATLNGIIVSTDDLTGNAIKIERISIK